MKAKVDTNKRGDAGFAILMGIAAAVSGYMSFMGAWKILNNFALALPFAIVVQGSVFAALWLLPQRPFTQKLLLSAIWAVAASFSVGSAYLQADEGNLRDRGTAAAVQVQSYIAEAHKRLRAERANVNSLFAIAEAEKLGRGRSGNGPGEGPMYARLREEAESAEAALNALGPVETAIRQAQIDIEALPEDADPNDVQAILDRVTPHLISLGVAVSPVAIESPYQRLIAAWSALNNTSDETTRQKVAFTILVAFLMEALTVLLAITRLVMLRPADKRTLNQKLTDLFGQAVELRNLPVHVSRKSEILKNDLSNALQAEEQAVASRKPAPARSSRRRSGKQERPTDDEKTWQLNLAAQVAIDNSNRPTVLKNLMIETAKAWGSKDGRVDARFLRSQPAIRSGVFLTHVVEDTKEGVRRGPKWNDWMRFVSSELAKVSGELQSEQSARTSVVSIVGGK